MKTNFDIHHAIVEDIKKNFKPSYKEKDQQHFFIRAHGQDKIVEILNEITPTDYLRMLENPVPLLFDTEGGNYKLIKSFSKSRISLDYIPRHKQYCFGIGLEYPKKPNALILLLTFDQEPVGDLAVACCEYIKKSKKYLSILFDATLISDEVGEPEELNSSAIVYLYG